MDKKIIFRSDYLANISKVVDIPHLKTHYRIASDYLLDSNTNMVRNGRVCSKCQLDSSETIFYQIVKPPLYKHLQNKYERKVHLTKFQKKQMKQISKYKQKLIIKCLTCKNIVTHPLIKPNKQLSEVESLETPIKSTRKRKHKDMLAGINREAVQATQQELNQSFPIIDYVDDTIAEATSSSIPPFSIMDYVSIDDSPCLPKKTKKCNDFIEFNDSVTCVSSVESKTKNKNNKKQGKISADISNNNCIENMKGKVKEVSEARNNLNSLSTKKEKKKLKHKLKKLQDAIKNIEHHTNKPKSSLKDFLSTIAG